MLSVRSCARWLLIPSLWLTLVSGESVKAKLYPGVLTREALLRGSLPPFNTAAEAVARTCTLAAQDIPADLPLEVFSDDLAIIASYKQAWQKICRSAPDASLADTFQLARQLEIMLRNPLFAAGLPAESELRRDAIYARLDVLDQFIPAFYGHAESGEFYAFNRSLFYLFALEGNAEDKSFFQLHFKYRRQIQLFPWQSLGLCTKFGEFDWPKSLSEFKKAQQNLRHQAYRQAVTEWEKALLFEFEVSHQEFCVCSGERQDLVLDVEALAIYFAQEQGHETSISKLKSLLDDLNQGRRRVRNYAEEGCVLL